MRGVTPEPAHFSVQMALDAARELGLWIERDGDNRRIVLKNYSIGMITPSIELVNRDRVQEKLQQPAQFEATMYSWGYLDPGGVLIEPIPAIYNLGGTVSFEIQVHGIHCDPHKAGSLGGSWTRGREEIGLLIGAWLNPFIHQVVLPEPVVIDWKEKVSGRNLMSDAERICFASER